MKPTVVAIYCPLWHTYDHAASWKGEGWCEWELLKTARPRFTGHYQPYQPLWGAFDESDPRWSAREIALAADNGVDVFLVDWYWYSGVRIMEEALEQGLLKARNRRRIQFALMWANHPWADYFPAPFGQKWNSWLPIRHTPSDWQRVIDYCIEHYFTQSNYWQPGGKLFFSIFEPLRLVRELGGASAFARLLEATQRTLQDAGLPPLHLNAMTGDPAMVSELRQAGYASVTSYNVTPDNLPALNGTVGYTQLIEKHLHAWQSLAQAPLPYLPVVTMGWDVSPRCETGLPWPFPPSPLTGATDYPYWPVVVDNTPERFGELCRLAVNHLQQTQPEPYALFVNAWNEWTEGSFLLPDQRYGEDYLSALVDVVK